MASEAYRRYFCPHESQDLSAHQPSNHKTADHSQCSESFYTWSGLRCWPTLCMRWLLEYVDWCGVIRLGEHSRWLRWRSRSIEAHGVRFRLLAGDCLRLSLLLIYLRRDNDRTVEKLGDEDLSCGGWSDPRGSYYKLSGRRIREASARQRTSCAVPEDLAGDGREPPIKAPSVHLSTYCTPHSPLH